MSMDLYLWKAPVTGDEEEARKLVRQYFDSDEQGVFEPSPDIGAVSRELQRLYPFWPISGEELLARMPVEEQSRYTPEGLAQLRESGSYDQAEDGPWSEIPFDETDNLLVLSIRWSADNEVLDDIVRLGREHELVIYDPQGPSVYLPDDPEEESGPTPPPTLWEWVKMVAIAAFLCAVTYAAWQIPVGWIRWPAVIVAGFIASAGLFVLGLMIGHALGFIKDED